MPNPQQPSQDPDARLERELAGLKAEYERLRDDKVRTEQNLANLKIQLEELEAKALADYGSADPVALAELLEAKRAENVRLVEDYKEHINSLRQSLDGLAGQ